MKYFLSLLTPELLNKLEELFKQNPTMSFGDGLDIIYHKYPELYKDFGTIHEDGRFTKSEISEEGINTQELNLKNELDKLK